MIIKFLKWTARIHLWWWGSYAQKL